MALWLYQLTDSEESTARSYPVENYRCDIWEGVIWRWPKGHHLVKAEGRPPRPGDLIVTFYAPTSCPDEPGFYGWGIVVDWREKDECPLLFRMVAPSDRLKMYPWWDVIAEQLAEDARPGRQGTLFRVENVTARKILKGIANWTGGHCSPPHEPPATQA